MEITMKRYGITNISFFGGDGSTQSYIDADGRYRYERNRSGSEFVYAVNLSDGRSVTIRTVAFDNDRSLDELEIDAQEQLKRILIELGKIAADIPSKNDSSS